MSDQLSAEYSRMHKILSGMIAAISSDIEILPQLSRRRSQIGYGLTPDPAIVIRFPEQFQGAARFIAAELNKQFFDRHLEPLGGRPTAEFRNGVLRINSEDLRLALQ